MFSGEVFISLSSGHSGYIISTPELLRKMLGIIA
jgi:hypothetical protein